ncbi:DUF2480 family protein [Litoribacter alkaliphilus]|uniref:DUF2480 family protein n=1 Tax=Litoribacter ruber TaxID=702568 RepID=A0AAP2CFQ7_9BACT|nr:DUF2480 family protein [Litoribacter alkaliphilus]MBS9523771.1 DUF2480 family protein [Litoribacter alkaliphilus]
MSEIVNRVANSPIITVDLEEYYTSGERSVFDLKGYLFQELVLKELDFRKALKELDWEQFRDKHVAVFCSVDAIVPTWAFMLVSTYLEGVAKTVVLGNEEALEQFLYQEALQKLNPSDFEGRPVVVKGCGDLPVPLFAYGEVVRKLKPIAKSIMYGEPCSTVPLYKRR